MWTHFWDMHSGGHTKEPPYEHIYIEEEEKVASVVFYNRFGHSPYHVTCPTCGSDYSVYEDETLESISEYHRQEGFGDNRHEKFTVEEYQKQKNVLIVPASEIKPEEREGHCPKGHWEYMED